MQGAYNGIQHLVRPYSEQHGQHNSKKNDDNSYGFEATALGLFSKTKLLEQWRAQGLLNTDS